MRSLQFVSVDFVRRNLFDFAEGPVLRCAISTVRECRFRAAKSVSFAEGPVLRCAISTGSECRFRAAKSV